MDHIRNRTRLSSHAMAAALVVAATSTYADGAGTRDCAPGAVQADIEGRPLTRSERIARLDEALNESLARFDECQNAALATADQDTGAESAGGDTAGAGGGAEGSRNAAASESDESAASDHAIESVAAEGVEGTEAPEDGEETTSGTERPPGAGAIPDDIPEPDNDSVLEAQIRRAAMEEEDPKVRAELWNEYRKYKGLPTRPLPEDDGEPSDAQSSD
ncbi:MAG: hypothetical protein OXU81_12830 [Gammaproteobacteria bacterium]|nr:hypothetical protein [Gammaproteobacteria bacterium]